MNIFMYLLYIFPVDFKLHNSFQKDKYTCMYFILPQIKLIVSLLQGKEVAEEISDGDRCVHNILYSHM